MGYSFNKGLSLVNIATEVKINKCRVKERTSLREEEFQDMVGNINDPIIKCVVYTMGSTSMPCLN